MTNTTRNIVTRHCSGFARRKKPPEPCKNAPVSPKTVAKWRDRLSVEEAEVARAIAPKYCRQHLWIILDGVFPGAKLKERLVGNTWKGYKRNTINGIATMQAMQRAGLVRQRPFGLAPQEFRCTATAKHTRERCRGWRIRGWTVCRFHGAGSHKLTPEERAERRKRRQLRSAQRLQRSLERRQRREAGLLSSSVGFAPEKPAAPSLEDQFRAHRPRPGGKPYDPTR
jgi:hypothetical protein